jgi:hypothetical protein
VRSGEVYNPLTPPPLSAFVPGQKNARIVLISYTCIFAGGNTTKGQSKAKLQAVVRLLAGVRDGL